MYSVRYSSQILIKSEISRQNFEKSSNFMKLRPVGSELFNAGRQTNMTKLRATFRNSADKPTSTRNVNAGGSVLQ